MEKRQVRPAFVEISRWQVRLRSSATAAAMFLGSSGSATIDVGALKPRVGAVLSFVMWNAAVRCLGATFCLATLAFLNLE